MQIILAKSHSDSKNTTEDIQVYFVLNQLQIIIRKFRLLDTYIVLILYSSILYYTGKKWSGTKIRRTLDQENTKLRIWTEFCINTVNSAEHEQLGTRKTFCESSA